MTLHEKIDRVLACIGHGWCTLRKAHALADAIVELKPDVVCEIGTFAGRSFLPMALAIQQNGHGIAYGIDPYDQKASAEGEAEAHADWWKSFDPAWIEEQFHITLEAANLMPWVALLRNKSCDVTPPKNIGVLHIDGNHSAAARSDVERFAPNVIKGGYVFLDDLVWESGEVSASIPILENMGFVEQYRVIGQADDEPYFVTPFFNNWGVWKRA